MREWLQKVIAILLIVISVPLYFGEGDGTAIMTWACWLLTFVLWLTADSGNHDYKP